MNIQYTNNLIQNLDDTKWGIYIHSIRFKIRSKDEYTPKKFDIVITGDCSQSITKTFVKGPNTENIRYESFIMIYLGDTNKEEAVYYVVGTIYSEDIGLKLKNLDITKINDTARNILKQKLEEERILIDSFKSIELEKIEGLENLELSIKNWVNKCKLLGSSDERLNIIFKEPYKISPKLGASQLGKGKFYCYSRDEEAVKRRRLRKYEKEHVILLIDKKADKYCYLIIFEKQISKLIYERVAEDGLVYILSNNYYGAPLGRIVTFNKLPELYKFEYNKAINNMHYDKETTAKIAEILQGD